MRCTDAIGCAVLANSLDSLGAGCDVLFCEKMGGTL